MNVRKMTIADIEYLNLEADWMKGRYESYLNAQTGPAWILEDESGPLCAFGAAFFWEGVAEVWFNLISRRKIFSQIKIARQYLDEQTKIFKAHRVFATTKCDFKVGQRFLEWFGFKCETPEGMAGYNPDGSSAYLYAKVI